jgi:hypothetical protein
MRTPFIEGYQLIAMEDVNFMRNTIKDCEKLAMQTNNGLNLLLKERGNLHQGGWTEVTKSSGPCTVLIK